MLSADIGILFGNAKYFQAKHYNWMGIRYVWGILDTAINDIWKKFKTQDSVSKKNGALCWPFKWISLFCDYYRSMR